MANGGLVGPVKVICTSSTKVTTITSSGTFTKKNCTSTVPEILVVAGGGGGGATLGGGGGAGGYRTATCVSLGKETSVTIGAGGAGGTHPTSAVIGSDTTLGSVGIDLNPCFAQNVPKSLKSDL